MREQVSSPPAGQDVVLELQRRRWFALTVVSAGTFMTPLDSSIVAVALPAIGADLQLSYSYGLWMQAAYLLVTSALLIPAGRLADARGPVLVNLLGTVVFVLGSLVAGFAHNGLVMLVGRCVQGAGGALMFSTSSGIIAAVFPAQERGKALGLQATVAYAGLLAGPILGGLIVSHLHWRWIYLINVPIGVAVLLAGWALIGAERRDRQAESHCPSTASTPSVTSRRVDWLGGVLLAATLAAFFIPLTFAPLWGWGSGRTIGPLATAVVLLLLLVRVEGRVSQPMLELDLLRRNRVFATTNAAALVASTAFYAVTTLTAVFMQVVQGRSARDTGLMLLVQPVFMVGFSSWCGRLSDRLGARLFTVVGAIIIAVGMGQLAFASASTVRVLLALGTVGLGQAVFNSPNMSAVLGSVPRTRLSLAAGFMSTMRFTGQGVSIAILGSIAAWPLGSEGARIIFLGETAGSVGAQAFSTGYRSAILVGAVFAVAAAVLSWASRPSREGTA